MIYLAIYALAVIGFCSVVCTFLALLYVTFADKDPIADVLPDNVSPLHRGWL